MISTKDFDAEIQPANPTVNLNDLGNHIIYDMEDLIFPDDISFGEAVDGFSEFAAGAMNDTDSEVGSANAYTMNLNVASDSRRMSDFSSSSAEASNAVTIVNQMNARYLNMMAMCKALPATTKEELLAWPTLGPCANVTAVLALTMLDGPPATALAESSSHTKLATTSQCVTITLR